MQPPEDTTSLYAAGSARTTPFSKILGCGGPGPSLTPQGSFVGGLVLETNKQINQKLPKTKQNKTKHPKTKCRRKKALRSRGTHLLVSSWL